jgi:hypothetical protein
MKYKAEVNSFFFVMSLLTEEGTDTSLGPKHVYKTGNVLNAY